MDSRLETKEQKTTQQDRIDRITTMETYLDEIENVINQADDRKENLNQILSAHPALMEKLHLLFEYYFNGLWLQDYEADERGELPTDLKRGVLGQDTIYNLYIDTNDI